MRGSAPRILPAFGLALLATACGSPPATSAPPLNCGALSPCGGDLTGTWVVRGECAVDHACDGAVYDFSAAGTTLTFTGSKMTISGGGVAHQSIPLSCFNSMTAATTCNRLSSTPGYACSASSDTCSCNIDYTVYNQSIGSMPRTYGKSNNDFIVDGQAYAYCIFNGLLRFAPEVNGGLGPISEYVKM